MCIRDSPVPQLFGSSKPSTYMAMPPPQDRYEVNLELVTLAGTEEKMQANLSHYEDVAELEDDILCFLPTVSDLEVFGCELELLDLQRPQLQIVVRPCMVEGHTLLDWGDIEQWVQAEHNAFLCATNSKNLIGWSCSLRKNQIQTLLTRS